MYTPRLKTKYAEEIQPVLKELFGYSSSMAIPKLQKISINQGVGVGTTEKKKVDAAIEEMTTITGQKAVPTFSKKDISNFKLRKGMAIGAKVTLRGVKMYEFLDRFISVALPRTRDFRGISRNGFDGRGNYSVGVKEQIIFPEIDIDKIDDLTGMDITFVTSANTDKEAFELLKSFGLPFKNE